MSKPAKSSPPRKRRGAPSRYTPAVGRAICAALAQGQSLRSICEDAGMPDRTTVVRWLAANPGFAAEYRFAREIGFDALAELALAEATANVDPEHVQRARLAWDARRWHLAKMMPKKYGDRAAVEHTGADGGPIATEVREVGQIERRRRTAAYILKLADDTALLDEARALSDPNGGGS